MKEIKSIKTNLAKKKKSIQVKGKNQKKQSKKVIKKPLKKIPSRNQKIITKSVQNRKSPIKQKTKLKLINEKDKIYGSMVKDPKFRITESRIKKLLDFEHIEELFYLLNILNDKQVETFIKHYKESGSSSEKIKDKKIESAIKNSKTKIELVDKIKKELINSLNEEYKELKERISSIRKKGADVYVEDLKAMTIPLKIRMFSATSSKEDFYKIKKTMNEVNENLRIKEEEFEREELKEKQRNAKGKKENEK